MTVKLSTSSPPDLWSPPPIPPLQNGDRLTADEFERRYFAMPSVKKAELIDGVVYMPSPVSHVRHGQPHFQILGWLYVYINANDHLEGGDNSTLRLDKTNQPQPDAFLRILPEHGGQSTLDAEGYLTTAPELIVEVAATSASYDRNQKLDVYRRHNVREYIVWRVLDRAIDWFVLRDGGYQKLETTDGILRSPLFPGLWLNVEALLAGDSRPVLDTLAAGIAAMKSKSSQ